MKPAATRGRHRRWYATLLLICIAAFFLSALVSKGIFERIPHVEDEAAYLFQAQVFASGRLSVPTPPYPNSYWSPFVVDYQGQRFGKYPPGFPLLLGLGVGIGQPWMVNALLAALALWLVAILGRVIYSPSTGLLAAALGLTCPVFLALSATLLSHPTSLCFTLLFLWASARLIQEPTGHPLRYATLAGLGLGYLLLTRPYDAVGISLPLALYSLVRVLRGDRVLLRHWVITAIIVALFGFVLAAYWYAQSGHLSNPYRLVWSYDQIGFGPDRGPRGYSLASGLFYIRYNLRALATSFLGWPGYLNLLFLWVPFVLRPRERWNYLLLATFASLVGLYATYWYYGGHDAGFPRYYYAALPALLLLTARGVQLLSLSVHRLALSIHPTNQRTQLEDIAPSTSSPAPRITDLPIPQFATLLIYLPLLALVLYNSLFFLPVNLEEFRAKNGITASPLEVVRRSGIANAIVFIPDYEYWWDFAVFFAANSPTMDSEVIYAIYYDQEQAQAVRAVYAGRQCFIQSQAQLLPCPF